MYKIFLFVCIIGVTTAFVDHNPQEFERRRLMQERDQREAERQQQLSQSSQFRHRFYRSINDIDLDIEPNLNLEDELELPTIIRQRRSQLPNIGGVNIEKSGDDTIGTIKVGHKTDRYEVGGTWQKVIRGPNKAKPNFSIGGTYRW